MFWKNYTGADATAEILIMLLGAFLLGAALMYLYDKYFFECVDEGFEEDIQPDIIESENVIEEKYNDSDEDDLKIIEGIGPKIESILKSKGIKTLKKLSETSKEEIKEILLEVGGERYAFHDPTTWADQAKLAHEGKMEELQEYQDFLMGGKM